MPSRPPIVEGGRDRPQIAARKPDVVRASQRARGEDPALVDALLEADAARRSAVFAADNLRAEQKRPSASRWARRRPTTDRRCWKAAQFAGEGEGRRGRQSEGEKAFTAAHKGGFHRLSTVFWPARTTSWCSTPSANRGPSRILKDHLELGESPGLICIWSAARAGVRLFAVLFPHRRRGVAAPWPVANGGAARRPENGFSRAAAVLCQLKTEASAVRSGLLRACMPDRAPPASNSASTTFISPWSAGLAGAALLVPGLEAPARSSTSSDGLLRQRGCLAGPQLNSQSSPVEVESARQGLEYRVQRSARCAEVLRLPLAGTCRCRTPAAVLRLSLPDAGEHRRAVSCNRRRRRRFGIIGSAQVRPRGMGPDSADLP